MTPLFELVPLEIVEMIIDCVAEEDDPKNSNLRACSLTCKTFLPRCRKHLFMTIEVTPELLSKFINLVQNAPWIARNIHGLGLWVDLDPFNKISPSAFVHIVNLRILTLKIACLWMEVQPSLRSSLLHLIRLPTISTLGFSEISGLLLSELALSSNLKFLLIHDALFDDENVPPKSFRAIKFQCLNTSSLSAQNLVTVHQKGKANGQPIFDFGELEIISFEWQDQLSQCYLQLLAEACNLQTIHVCMHDFSSVLSNSWSSLRNLHIHISSFEFISSDVDTISLLCRQLQKIARDNFIEYLCLNLLMDHTFGLRLEDVQWDSFDQVVLAPEQWLSLEQFDLWVYVDYSSEHPVDMQNFETTVKNVRTSRLSGLISNKLFKFRSFFKSDSYEHFLYRAR